MLLLGLYTGQRCMDCASLRWSNVDLIENKITLVSEKTERAISVPIAKPLRVYLETLPAGDDPTALLHPDIHAAGTGPGGVARLSAQFHQILFSAGLVKARPPKAVSTGIGRDGARAKTTISFHSLRRNAVSLLKSAGVPVAVVMDIVGHDSVDVSNIYTEISDAAKVRAIGKLKDITK